MRFNEFHESIYVIKEAVLAIASFFCPKTVPFVMIRGDTYDSNYSCWIGCT
ncbi:hypothetical protein ACIQZD_02895 [Peribacillus sp. NPDC096447]|uniref:hypothetical protein n=1 Tax=Peribacillus sp. NPDC096447 TaxID=3364394 RepID=UPI00382C18D6